MRTDDLINALSADAAMTRPTQARQWSLSIGLGALASLAMLAMILKVRVDIASAIHEPRFLFKFVALLALAVPAVWLAIASAGPLSSARSRWGALLLAPVLVALACAGELWVEPSSSWAPRALGANAIYCMACVPIFSLAPLAGILLALSRGAPTNQRLAGLLAGLAAGGIGGCAYALHCTDDSPLFLAVWYSIGIAAIAALGAWLGPRVLKW